MSDLAIGDAPEVDAFAARLLSAALGMFDQMAIYLGERLGFYGAMADGAWSTSGELAARTGTHERYVREWLEQQAVTAIVEVEDPLADPRDRRFRLPSAHAAVLADSTSVVYAGQRAVELARVARQLPALVEAFRSGNAPPAIPWAPEGRAEYNRAIFLGPLTRAWLPSVPEIDARLKREPPARVADLGCGTGWSSIAMATAYPTITVDGFDLDAEVLAAAVANAAAAGVADRVRFRALDVSGLDADVAFDLVTVFEALHDMARPVAVLTTIRRLLAPGGLVLIADERVEERFTAPAGDRERYVYGWSVMSCLPAVMGEPGSAETGAVMRAGTLRTYANEAGFGRVDVLPVDADVLRFYLLGA